MIPTLFAYCLYILHKLTISICVIEMSSYHLSAKEIWLFENKMSMHGMESALLSKPYPQHYSNILDMIIKSPTTNNIACLF